MTTYYYLYHLRDPANSAGFGFDGYLGITDNPHRREADHMRALKSGKHKNLRLQEYFEKSGGNLKMRIVKRGTQEEVLVSEALVVDRPNKHANVQKGGGPMRGMGKDALLDLFAEHAKANAPAPRQTISSGKISASQGALIAAAVVGIAVGAYYGYRWYRRRKVASVPPVVDSDEYALALERQASRRAKAMAMGIGQQTVWQIFKEAWRDSWSGAPRSSINPNADPK